jgi:ribonuclease J
VLLLCSDSTYAEVEGYTPSEQVVGEALDRVIGDADGRVMIATFASLISRVQQIVTAAAKHGRKVAVIGRSMINNVRMARQMGYLEVPDGVLVSLKQARKVPPNKLVIVATGAQGEPTSALVRIAMGSHPDIEVVPGDTVVISASPIPGNETLVARTIDNLHRQGAAVLYSRIALVHVHGHGSREELKMMLSLVKPRFFVPVHGEYRHLVAHAAIARSAGVPDSNTFVLEDGDVLELTEDSGEVVGTVPAGIVYIEGQRRWTESSVLDERLKLARDGVVVVVASTSRDPSGFLKEPDVVSAGLHGTGDSAKILKKVSEEVLFCLDQSFEQVLDYGRTRRLLSDRVSEIFYEETRARPTVLVHLRDE